MQPLRGIRVLDFSKVLAGPQCTQALADLGASVIKVETPEGDDTRSWPPIRGDAGTMFLSANRGKRSIVLDLKSRRGIEVAQVLAKQTDVVVESYSDGVPARLGVDYPTLSAMNPRLIYCSISGFGRKGPLKASKGYDMMLQAFTGMVSVMGEPGGATVRAPFSPVDQGTGQNALIGILAALINRQQTSAGTLVEVSLFDTGLSYMSYLLQATWERGTEPEKFACGHESLCPYQVFQTSDKMLLIGVGNDALWRKLCACLGLENMALHPDFATNPVRVANRNRTVDAVQAAVARFPCEEVAQRLTEAGIPNSPVNTLGDISRHPHTKASGMVGQMPGSDGDGRFVRSPLKFDGRRNVAELPSPALGEHTAEVLSEAGYSSEDIDSLVRSGAAR
jgi:crotonobetainyl-CoA:carnitine CoA-transferase CaiB-like acyl-CoA transferase